MRNWESRNNLETNQEYLEKVLKRFDIDKYHYIYTNGEVSLIIEKNLKKYKVLVNNQKRVLEVYRCDVHSSFAKHTKENFKFKTSFKDDCIWNSIKWIYKDCKIKG